MKNYWLYFACRIASILGGSLQNAIIPIVILEGTKSGGTLGSVLGIQEVLLLLTSFVAGYIADKFNRKYIMIICDLINAGLLGGYIFLAEGDINYLFALIFIQNSVNKIFFAASGTIFSQIVKSKDLLKRKSLMKTVIRIINISAPPIGIFLYTKLGLNFILTINLLSFLISGIFEFFIRYKSHLTKIKKKERINIIKEYQEPLVYIKNADSSFKGLMLFMLSVNFFFNPIISVVFPFIITSYLKLPVIFLGYTMSSAAIGYIAGGSILAKYPEKFELGGKLWKKMVIINFIVLAGIPVSLYVFSNNLLLCQLSIISLFFIFGATNIIYVETLFVYFEIVIPHKIKGRAFSLIEIFGSILTPIGYFLVAGIIDKVNPLYLSLTASGLCAIFYFIVVVRRVDSKDIKMNLEKFI